jgi:hypothetical protein
VTRPHLGPPERPRSFRRRSSFPLSAFVAAASLALVVAGCIGGETVNPPTAGPSTPSAAPSSSPSAASPSASAAPSTAPPATASPTASPTPTPTPTSTEDPSATDATADACTGTDDNREFFAGAAAGLSWPVYCAILPARWNVTEGSWSRGGGGQLEIAYRGPDGATLSLHQGAACGSGDACQVAGTDAGDSPFGDQSGTFVQLADGGWMIVVDRGANPSWAVIGHVMDETAFRTIAADLARLD